MAISPDRKLRDCPENQIGISVPTPLDARLDALVRRANEAGENTSRKELVAALILVAPADGEELISWIRRYRTASAMDVVADGDEAEPYLADRSRKPGPRRRER